MSEIRGDPKFRTGLSILSAKGFLGAHPPFPKYFQWADKNLSTKNHDAFYINSFINHNYYKYMDTLNIEVHYTVTSVSIKVQ